MHSPHRVREHRANGIGRTAGLRDRGDALRCVPHGDFGRLRGRARDRGPRAKGDARTRPLFRRRKPRERDLSLPPNRHARHPLARGAPRAPERDDLAFARRSSHRAPDSHGNGRHAPPRRIHRRGDAAPRRHYRHVPLPLHSRVLDGQGDGPPDRGVPRARNPGSETECNRTRR
jgi:hypothetical protein